jgi:hypothetical protein
MQMGYENMRNPLGSEAVSRELPPRPFPTIQQQITALQPHVMGTRMSVLRWRSRRCP